MLNRKALRVGLLSVILLFGAMQLIPIDRSNPPVLSDVDTPDDVKRVLRRACYDCHSNETRWPWYSRIAPASWFLARHVRKGRADLNFSEWPTFDFEAQEYEFEDIREKVADGDMPLRSYKLIHWDARLSDEDRALLLRWSEWHDENN